MKNAKIYHSSGQLSTPCYIIDTNLLRENTRIMKDAFASAWPGKLKMGYSVKTNHFQWLLKYAKELGYFAETVSGSEYLLALSVGYSSSEIIYNGPQKSGDVFFNALKGAGVVNIDNLNDIDFIEDNIEKITPFVPLLGIRVNFDMEKYCPGETTAGDEVSRFGICIENGDFKRAVNRIHRLGLNVDGLHMHYSTTSRSLAVFCSLAETASTLILKHSLSDEISFLDMGGGFYGGQAHPAYPSMIEYARVISEGFSDLPKDKITLILEPGISVVSTAVDYMCKVINTRDVRGTRIVTTDGSTLHFNPFHSSRVPQFTVETGSFNVLNHQIICGSTCMENDRLLKLDEHNELCNGDTILIHNTGGYTMCYNNCFINPPPFVYKKENDVYELLRDRDEKLMQYI